MLQFEGGQILWTGSVYIYIYIYISNSTAVSLAYLLISIYTNTLWSSQVSSSYFRNSLSQQLSLSFSAPGWSSKLHSVSNKAVVWEKRLDRYYMKILHAFLTKQPTKQQLYGHLFPISQIVQVRWTNIQCGPTSSSLFSTFTDFKRIE